MLTIVVGIEIVNEREILVDMIDMSEEMAELDPCEVTGTTEADQEIRIAEIPIEMVVFASRCRHVQIRFVDHFWSNFGDVTHFQPIEKNEIEREGQEFDRCVSFFLSPPSFVLCALLIS